MIRRCPSRRLGGAVGGAVVAAAVVLLVAGCGSDAGHRTAPPASATASSSPPAAPEPLFVDVFATNDNDWPVGNSPDGVRLAVTGGRYRVVLPAGTSRFIRPAALAQRADVRHDVTVTAAVVLPAGTAGRPPVAFGVGLACRMNPRTRQYYLARYLSDGTAVILRRQQGGPERVLAATPRPPRPAPAMAGRPVQLALTCTGGAASRPAVVAFAVNDRVLIRARDTRPLPDDAPGIYAAAAPGTGGTFFFDTVAVAHAAE